MSRFQIYVDESGDRIRGLHTSPVYALSAAIVRDEEVGEVEAALDGISTALGKPAGTVLQWSRNLGGPAQRAEACDRIAATPLRLTNVVVLKQAIRVADATAPHAALTYADALLRLLERALRFVADRAADAELTVASVAGFTRAQLDAALDLGRSTRTRIRWDVLGSVRIGDPSRQRPLQAAGIAAGAPARGVRARANRPPRTSRAGDRRAREGRDGGLGRGDRRPEGRPDRGSPVVAGDGRAHRPCPAATAAEAAHGR